MQTQSSRQSPIPSWLNRATAHHRTKVFHIIHINIQRLSRRPTLEISFDTLMHCWSPSNQTTQYWMFVSQARHHPQHTKLAIFVVFGTMHVIISSAQKLQEKHKLFLLQSLLWPRLLLSEKIIFLGMGRPCSPLCLLELFQK